MFMKYLLSMSFAYDFVIDRHKSREPHQPAGNAY